MVAPLGVDPLEDEAFNLVGRVESVTILVVDLVGISLQNGAKVRGIGASILADDLPEDHHLSPAENVGRPPVEGGPIDSQPQIALFLRREASNRRAVEGHVVPILDEELLIVIEHVQPAFEVAEQQGHGLDSLLVRQVLEALLLNLVYRNACHPLLLGTQVQFFQFGIGEPQKVL